MCMSVRVCWGLVLVPRWTGRGRGRAPCWNYSFHRCRNSIDELGIAGRSAGMDPAADVEFDRDRAGHRQPRVHFDRGEPAAAAAAREGAQVRHRSEEHTSELQSLMRISYAVFCLKKKKELLNTTIHYNKY